MWLLYWVTPVICNKLSSEPKAPVWDCKEEAKLRNSSRYGLANQAEIFWIGCGRSAEFLPKISADLVEKKG